MCLEQWLADRSHSNHVYEVNKINCVNPQMCQQITLIKNKTVLKLFAAARGCLNSPETFFPGISSPGYIMLKVLSVEASFF